MELFTININTVQHRFHRRLCEWYLACVMLSAGIVLLFSGTFELPPYEIVRKIANQQTWAVLLTTLGGLRVMVLVANGAIRRGSPHMRAVLALLSAVLWAFLLAGLLAFNIPLLLGPFLAWAIFYDGANSYRAAQDAREEDDAGGVKNGPGS